MVAEVSHGFRVAQLLQVEGAGKSQALCEVFS